MSDKMEEFLESQELKHYGVPGMKWGKRKAGDSSGPSERQQKRAQYKADLKAGNLNKAHGREVTPAQAKAMRTNGLRVTAGLLTTYGALQLAGYGLGKAAESSAAKRFASAATAGAQANNANLKQIGDLSTFVLRKGANGSWG